MKIDLSATHELIDIEDDSVIYRIEEVHRLVDVFNNKLLTIVSPRVWDDPYEYFLKYCYGVSKETGARHNYEGYTKLIFAQCWTMNEESDAIWRIYSPNRDKVKIKTSVSKLHRILTIIKNKGFKSYIGKVKYVDEINIKQRISNLIRGTEKVPFIIKDDLIRNQYLFKRMAFSHEKEIRVLVTLPKPPEKYINAIYQDSDNLNLCHIPLEDPSDLFDELVFDPRMPNGQYKAYKSYFENELGYKKPIFKSNLYLRPNIVEKISDYFS